MAVTRTNSLAGVVTAALLLVAGCDGTSAPAPAPADPAAASRETLLGRWEPATGAQTLAGPAYVELYDDGRWTGSDGCNAGQGRWTVAPGGVLRADGGPGTQMGCANVPVADWLTDARTAQLSGDTLVLLDERGAETGRLRRAG